MRRRLLLIPVSAIAVMLMGASSCDTAPANSAEQSAQAGIQNQFNISQPLPAFKFSELRATLIAIETAQANVTQTTSFFFNSNVVDPIATCPSICFPLASTANLSNPQQVVSTSVNGNYGYGTVGQMDPNGIYSGTSTGTYVVCTAADGTTFLNYWEGFVETVSGPAVWDATAHTVHLTGPSTIHVKTKP